MPIIAVDPGKNGAIVTDDDEASYAMPATPGDAIALCRSLSPATVYIEKINGYIPAAGAAQMFEFGRMVERITILFQAFGCRVIEVPPQTWQKALGLGRTGRVKVERGMSAEQRRAVAAANASRQRDWKNKLKAEAQRRFPLVDVTLVNADALLLLEYARGGK